MHPEFLIFTNKSDLTSDYIVKEFRNRNLHCVRVNTEDFHLTKIIHKIESGSVFQTGKETVELSKIRSAYFRRPLFPDVRFENLSSSSLHYIREEWNYLLRSIYLELGEKWFSHPNNIILAEDKPKQLRLAKEIGFSVPETVITNDLASVEWLFKIGDVVAKPLKQSLLEDDKTLGKVIFTSTINSLSDIDESSLRFAPVIFQRKLHKKYDLRVTVVEDSVFSVIIKSQEFEKTKTDWRYSSVTELEHEVFDLPSDIAEYCRIIVRQLGLRFGAIDLVLDDSDQLWFLECNPNGQWAWIENRTGLQIAAAIVNSMEKF